VFEVDWSASDDAGIADVTIELRDSSDSVVDSVNPPVSGTSASGTGVELQDSKGGGDDYTIVVLVTDTAGQTDTDEVSDRAEGDDP
jgi:hypothetical protein